MNKWLKPTNPGNNPFGPDNINDILPNKDEIPKEFWHGRGKWNKLFGDWFFCGIDNLNFNLKDDIDGEIMMKHIGQLMGSYAPKHEHKEAACAWLWSLWCNDVSYDVQKRKG